MAEAFFNRLAAGRAEAVSAGTGPADSVDRAERVISMGCGVEESCPATLTITEDWGLDDPEGGPLDRVREVRDEIRARVVDLVEMMTSEAA